MEDLEDFTYLVSSGSGPVFHIREIRPKDFYFAQILRQKDEGYLPLVLRLILNDDVLDEAPISQTKSVFRWIGDNVLNQNVLTVENWLEVAFHLCKQRWDSSLEWIEDQPMSKVQTMIQILKKNADEQEKEMKKSSRRRK